MNNKSPMIMILFIELFIQRYLGDITLVYHIREAIILVLEERITPGSLCWEKIEEKCMVQ